MYKEKISAWVDAHKDEMIEDIFELCRINSEKMPEEEDMPFVRARQNAWIRPWIWPRGTALKPVITDGYVGCVDMNELPKQLDILAHLDVVPAGEGWTVTKPFKPVLKDGKLYGRGTADDKGPAVAALYAMRAVKELGIPLKKNVRLILGTDEECGSSDIKHYYSMEKEAPMTFSPDAAYPLVNTEKGRFPGHFTAKFEASEALPRLVSIKAGTKVNVVPGKARAAVEGFAMTALEAAAAETEKETGIHFDFEADGTFTAVTATGVGRPCVYPGSGQQCPDRSSGIPWKAGLCGMSAD